MAPLSPALKRWPEYVSTHASPSPHPSSGCAWVYHPYLTVLDPAHQTSDVDLDPVTGDAAMHGPGHYKVDMRKSLTSLCTLYRQESLHLRYKRHFVCRKPRSTDVPAISEAAAMVEEDEKRKVAWENAKPHRGVFPKGVLGAFSGGWEGYNTYPVYPWTPHKEALLAKPGSTRAPSPPSSSASSSSSRKKGKVKVGF